MAEPSTASERPTRAYVDVFTTAVVARSLVDFSRFDICLKDAQIHKFLHVLNTLLFDTKRECLMHMSSDSPCVCVDFQLTLISSQNTCIKDALH